MSITRRLLLLGALILWIVYSKDTLLPHVTAIIVNPVVSYIVTGIVTFAGGWILWRLTRG